MMALSIPEQLRPQAFFNLSDPTTAAFFADCTLVWEVLHRLDSHIERLIGDEQTILGSVEPGAYLSDDRPLFIAPGALVERGAYIQGPAYIGPNVVVRHGALVRENVIVLEGSVVGHASEVKNSLLLPHCHAPHFNYVGDSVLGHHVNLGAGTKLSNLTLISEKDRETGHRPTISIAIEDELFDTGLAKLGAILGDGAQTGCNAVLNPGCIVGQRSLVYPNLSLRKGYFPPDSVLKLRQTFQVRPRR